MEYKGKQINFKVTDKQYQQIVDCCEILGISKSDFIRNATFNYINQCYIQEMISMIYQELKKIDLSKATKEDLIEFETYMNMFEHIAKFGKDN